MMLLLSLAVQAALWGAADSSTTPFVSVAQHFPGEPIRRTLMVSPELFFVVYAGGIQRWDSGSVVNTIAHGASFGGDALDALDPIDAEIVNAVGMIYVLDGASNCVSRVSFAFDFVDKICDTESVGSDLFMIGNLVAVSVAFCEEQIYIGGTSAVYGLAYNMSAIITSYENSDSLGTGPPLSFTGLNDMAVGASGNIILALDAGALGSIDPVGDIYHDLTAVAFNSLFSVGITPVDLLSVAIDPSFGDAAVVDNRDDDLGGMYLPYNDFSNQALFVVDGDLLERPFDGSNLTAIEVSDTTFTYTLSSQGVLQAVDDMGVFLDFINSTSVLDGFSMFDMRLDQDVHASRNALFYSNGFLAVTATLSEHVYIFELNATMSESLARSSCDPPQETPEGGAGGDPIVRDLQGHRFLAGSKPTTDYLLYQSGEHQIIMQTHTAMGEEHGYFIRQIRLVRACGEYSITAEDGTWKSTTTSNAPACFEPYVAHGDQGLVAYMIHDSIVFINAFQTSGASEALQKTYLNIKLLNPGPVFKKGCSGMLCDETHQEIEL